MQSLIFLAISLFFLDLISGAIVETTNLKLLGGVNFISRGKSNGLRSTRRRTFRGRPTKAALQVAQYAVGMENIVEEVRTGLNIEVKGSREGRQHFWEQVGPLMEDRMKELEGKVDHKEFCPLDPADFTQCDTSARYRTFTGRCNNLRFPAFGSALQTLRRLQPSQYQDEVSIPRQSSLVEPGIPLPNPRSLSSTLHKQQEEPDSSHSLLLMQWGQFIDHDMASVPGHRGPEGAPLDCQFCSSGREHPGCYPILLPNTDQFYRRRGCMNFVRSLPGQRQIGPREQLNQVTAFLDGSMIYGSSACEAAKLRDGDMPGLLDTTSHPLSRPNAPLKALPPLTKDNPDCQGENGNCFLAGDERVNEHPGLAIFHTVFIREHNAVARTLKALNPHWDGERIFQETRKIIGAFIQHITYTEFLPRVLGNKVVQKFELEPLPVGYFNNYNKDCSASIFTEFSSAAFRFGHSMIGPNLTMMTEEQMTSSEQGRQIPLRELFQQPDLLMSIPYALDDFVRGLAMPPMMPMDNDITEEVRNHLFEMRNKSESGLDLVSLNIQRGRDHGIPGYNNYRELCGLSRATTFQDFLQEISSEQVARLSSMYSHPEDVDLYSGLLSETKRDGTQTGPTLACIIGLQFRHLRHCDRFWYESGDPRVGFSPQQLKEIRSMTLTSLLCRNMDQPGKLPKNCLDLLKYDNNEMVECSNIPGPNLAFWKENQ